MDSFFSRTELSELRGTHKASAPADAGGCEFCGLYKNAHHPKMKPTGGGGHGVLIVAEAPGEKEDARGTQLIGPAGQALRKALTNLGYDLDEDTRKTNAVRCRPPGNRTPTEQEIACCRQYVKEEITRFAPEVIIALGGVALDSLIGDRWGDDGLGGISRWRGYTIPDALTGAWICPTFHPSYVMRECGKKYGDGDRDKNPSVAITFEQDLAAAFKLVKCPFPKDIPTAKMVTIDEQGDKAVEWLHDTIKWYDDNYAGRTGDVPPVGIDFETTGLKPYRAGHRIVTCAVATADDQCVAFNITPKTQAAMVLLLKHPLIPKVAHNFTFENQWASVIWKAQIKNWSWCSMTAAHIEDNRGGDKEATVTSLRFQAAARLGIFGFKDDTDSYLKDTAGDAHGANSFNCIEDCPRGSLLLRNGMDALITRRLAIEQIASAERGSFN